MKSSRCVICRKPLGRTWSTGTRVSVGKIRRRTTCSRPCAVENARRRLPPIGRGVRMVVL